MTSKTTTPVVVVGVDGSPDSDAAIRWAEQYAVATHGTLHVVVCWAWPQTYGAPIYLDGFNPEADAKHVAETALVSLTLPAVRVRSSLREGAAGPALIDASADADLLVVGSHGHAVVPSLLLGSVSTYCVHHCSVPVVVVR